MMKHLYLSAWFTDLGNSNAVVMLHEVDVEALVNKFSMLCQQMPYIYKKIVLEVVVMTLVLYSA